MSTAVPMTDLQKAIFFDRATWALFLDLDGTLIDIAPTPEAVVIPSDLKPLLAATSEALGGALAIISGREVKFIDRIAGTAVGSIAGTHGGEMRMANGTLRLTAGNWLTPALADIVTRLADDHPALIVEKKDLAVAVHYRMAPHLGDEVRRRLCTAVTIADGTLVLQPGRMVFEVLPAHVNKGRALESFMEESPFHGRKPLAIGDDLTDEYMFAAAQQLGGLGIRVGSADIPTTATHLLPNPRAVRDWIGTVFGTAPERQPRQPAARPRAEPAPLA
jgi:trehalose 6-phosphate phosphatase